MAAHKPVISVHIPKTAGTSLISEIKSGAFGEYLLDYEDRPTSLRLRHKLRRMVSWPRARLRRQTLLHEYSIVHGHFLAGKYAFLYPEADFITFMREPVQRLLSHYYYFKYAASKSPFSVKRNPDIQLVADGRMDLVQFARQEMMVNMYARFTDGVALERYALIGITERYAESLAILNRMFATTLNVRHERRTDYGKYASEYEPLLPELKAANRENSRIYAAALQMFERHPRA